MRCARAGLVLLAVVLASSTALAGTISITFSLSAGSGLWGTTQSGGQPINLGSGSVFLDVAGAGPLTPTGSVAVIQNLFATGLGMSFSGHTLQLFVLPGTIVASGTNGFTASAGAGTAFGSVGGPLGVRPLMSFAGVLFAVSNIGTSGAAGFQLLNGVFGGVTAAQIQRTFVGTEVSRSYVPEPTTGLLLCVGLALALGSGWAVRFTGR
jgi:hypothetical protein